MSKTFEVGEKVIYIPKEEKGVVKSLCDDKDYVFVVYNCADEWHRYKDYTAARTRTSDLNRGWDKVSDIIRDYNNQ